MNPLSPLGESVVAGKFKRYDIDGNGEIDRGELKAVFKKLDPKRWTDRKIEQLLTSIDRSGDDAIQLEEFVAWLWGTRTDKAGEGELTLLLCSPFLLTASQDCTAKIWSIETGQAWRTFPGGSDGHKGAVNTAQFSSDGKAVLTSCEDGLARIWSVEDAIVTQRFTGHEAGVMSARFSLDATKVITASRDGDVRLWDADTGECLIAIRGDAGKLQFATFSPCGEHILTASLDGCARLWSVQTGDQVRVFEDQHFGALCSATFSADGSRVLTSSKDGTAVIWDAQTCDVLHIFEGSSGGIFYAEFSVDGSFVVTAEHGGTTTLWSALTGKRLQAYLGSGQISSAKFSPANAGIATASRDGFAHIFSTQTGKSLRTFLGHDGPVTWVSWAPPEGAHWPWAPETPLMRAISNSKIGLDASTPMVSPHKGHLSLESPLAFDPESTGKMFRADSETPLGMTLRTPKASRHFMS